MPLPRAEIEDCYFVRTDRTVEQNVAKYAFRGFVLGSGYSMYTLLDFKQPLPTWSLIVRGLACHAIPGAFYGVVFAGTTRYLDEVRGKVYGVSNAFIGGAVAGMCIGGRSLNPWGCMKATVYSSIFAGVLRYCLTEERRIEKETLVTEANKLSNEIYMERFEHLRPQA